MMNFSSSKNAFYYAEDKDLYTEWPSDCVEMTVDEVSLYCFGVAAEGKVLGSDGNGRPAWVDIPPPSRDEMVSSAESHKSQLLYEAEKSIRILERAKDLGIATDVELDDLKKLEVYSVLLMRVDTSFAPNIEWPQNPQ